MNELISVIVPIYRVEKYLRNCIDSIVNQTYPNLDIILVDDGSDDGCPKICDEYAAKDNRIRVIHKENGGLVSARQAALPLAKGTLVAYVDSDDWIEPNMYERLHDTMQKDHADVVICGHVEEGLERRQERINAVAPGNYSGEKLAESLFPVMFYEKTSGMWGISPACWDKLFKKELIFDEQMDVDPRIWDGEDHAFIYPSLLKAKSISVSEDLLYHHRIRTDSVATKFDPMAFERFNCLFNHLKRKFEKSKYWDTILSKQFPYQMRWFVMKHVYNEIGIPYYDEDTVTPAIIFPFSQVEKGSNIAIYGAADNGRTYYRQVKTTNYCNVVAWVAKTCGDDIKNLVSTPEVLKDCNYDYLILAVKKRETYLSIMNDLESMGVDTSKVIWPNAVLISFLELGEIKK